MYVGPGGVYGTGTDDVGLFEIKGSYVGDQVEFTKQYIGKHSL